jgi:sugar diacid utilization regulator
MRGQHIMEEKQPLAWTTVTDDLKAAALLPQQRDELITRSLQQMLASIPATGSALIWPCQQRRIPWRIYYAGVRRNAMYSWLSARLDYSIDVLAENLQQDLTASGLPDMPSPLLIRLGLSPSSLRGLWIMWPALPAVFPRSAAAFAWIEHVRQMLEALLEVVEKEEQFFSPSSPLQDREFLKALAHGDAPSLSAFLSLTRIVAQADFTFWATAYQDVIEISSHLGAKHSGFGFALARGQGVGGRVAAYGKPIVGDYRNSPYREPGVCEIIDSEAVRSGLALPVRYHTAPGGGPHVAAVLYATRRATTYFSIAERLLVQRLVRLLEPFPLEARPVSFFSPGTRYLPDHKMAWYEIVLHANQIESVEIWANQLIKGAVIVTDGGGSPYVLARSEQLEQIRSALSVEPGAAQVLSLATSDMPGDRASGHVYLCPAVALPPDNWPDFFADLLLACNIVIGRMEQVQGQLDRQRERWLRALFQGEPSPQVEQDGYRLGLPVESGQLCIFAWPHGSMQGIKSARKRMIAENVVLMYLKSPLIFLDADLAAVLLPGQAQQPLSKVHNALLKHCSVHPLWIVHGGHYHSLRELKKALAHTLALAQKACREEYAEYFLDTSTFGLDSLLENPGLTRDLDAFSSKLLTPLIEYDRANGSHLTVTFVLVQTLGSVQAVASQLGVHVNTIRYRLHRSEDVLGTEQASPKERTALALAAFIWQRFHAAE